MSRVIERRRSFSKLAFRISSDSDEKLWLENLDESPEMGLAILIDWNEGSRWKLVWSKIRPGIFHPNERAIIGDEVALKEGFGAAKMFFE